jgi:hypothetical protein
METSLLLRVISSEIQRHAACWKSIDILDEHATYIFFTCCLLHAGFLLGLLFNSEHEVTWSSKTLVDFQWTTWRYSSGNRNLHNNHCETSNPTFVSITCNLLTALFFSMYYIHILYTIPDGGTRNSIKETFTVIYIIIFDLVGILLHSMKRSQFYWWAFCDVLWVHNLTAERKSKSRQMTVCDCSR